MERESCGACGFQSELCPHLHAQYASLRLRLRLAEEAELQWDRRARALEGEVKEQRDHAAALSDELGRLREALEPFAKAADSYAGYHESEIARAGIPNDKGKATAPITIKMLRNARAALRPRDAKGGG